MPQDPPAVIVPRAPAAPASRRCPLERTPDLERGHIDLAAEPPLEQQHDGAAPPPGKPPGDDRWWEFPRFHGGDGRGLPRWQRLAILAIMLILSMLAGWLLGSSARIFARGLEAGRA